MEEVRPQSGRETGLGRAGSGQGVRGKILVRVGRGHLAWIAGMLELLVRTFT
jgi:hypothetical protein